MIIILETSSSSQQTVSWRINDMAVEFLGTSRAFLKNMNFTL